MHVISKRAFNDATKKHPNQRVALMAAHKQLEKNDFATPEEMKKIFSSLDNFKYKDGWYVIDIGGNNLRIMTCIQFRNNRMHIKHICTHAEYTKLCERYAKGEL